MNIELTLNETRVLGCLMEKSVTTPDQYPLTLNALVNACNQKSSRDPVLSLEPGDVQHTARQLEERHLLSAKQTRGSRVEKFTQRLCNTPFAEFQFSEAEFAVTCLLLLRGAQTPGELRTRSGRLFSFEDNADVAAVLEGLMGRDDGPFVARLPRKPGRQDSEYVHTFSGPVESAPAEPAVMRHIPPDTQESRGGAATEGPRQSGGLELEARVAALEREVAELRRLIRPPVEG